jgi:signal transduction histidine kinase
MNSLSWDFLNYVTALLLSGITSLGLGVFVLIKNRHSRVNQLFFLCALAIAGWSISQSTMHSDYTLTWIGSKIVHFCAPLIAVFFFHFITALTEKPRKWLLRYVYTAGISISLLGGFTTTVVESLWPAKVSSTFTLAYTVKPGSLYLLFLLFFVSTILYAVYILFKEFQVSTGTMRAQLKYVLIAAIVGFSGGMVNFCYPFRISIYPLTPFATYTVPAYAVIAAYAIVKHRLMDIKVALTKTGLLFAIYGFIIYFSFHAVVILQPFLEATYGQHWVYFPIAVYTILISLAPFIYIHLQRKMEDKILKKQKQYQKTLKQLSEGMTRIRNLNKLLDLTVIQIVRTVRVTHATIFLYNKDKNKYILKVSRGPSKKEPGLEFGPKMPLVSRLFDTRAPLAYDEMETTSKKTAGPARPAKDTDIRQIRLYMQETDAVLCIPGFIENRMIGFLVLGRKLSGEAYTQQDLDVFTTLTNQVTLAIDNAQSYEELINTKDQLLKGERLATIGKFASEVAHEIKNPLQAIKTFTELAYERRADDIFMEKFSRLAKHEVERINNFVRQLIKVAHPLPPKFEPVYVNEVIDSVLELMENDFNVNGIIIKKEYDIHSVRIQADKDQLKQVFLNLITNAVEAMEKTANKIIMVDTAMTGSDITIKISDTGCGIPSDAISRLFNPLFTTKENGSGLGLSIVDTIINNHRGSMEACNNTGEGRIEEGASCEGASCEGAAFIVKIPVEQPKTI